MIGLSEKSHSVLKRLREDGHFSEMADAYRFGIALALAHGVVPEEPPPPRTTIFSVATIDPDREIGSAIKALMEVGDVPIYRWAERLAEWGVTEIWRRAETGEINFTAIIDEAQQAS